MATWLFDQQFVQDDIKQNTKAHVTGPLKGQ